MLLVWAVRRHEGTVFTGGSLRQPLYFSIDWLTLEINLGSASDCQVESRGPGPRERQSPHLPRDHHCWYISTKGTTHNSKHLGLDKKNTVCFEKACMHSPQSQPRIRACQPWTNSSVLEHKDLQIWMSHGRGERSRADSVSRLEQWGWVRTMAPVKMNGMDWMLPFPLHTAISSQKSCRRAGTQGPGTQEQAPRGPGGLGPGTRE